MILKDRQKTVLKATVLEHLKTARPVASADLLYAGLGVGPATIRNEMLALDEFGYLEQPHTSSGRVPTDKGYRFFVDNLLSEMSLEKKDEDLLHRTFAIDEADDFVKELTLAIAEISDTFTAAGRLEEDIFYETGLARILEEPELDDPMQARMFGRFADMLDETIRSIFVEESFSERVFIGKENPLKEAEEFSMFVSSWHHPGGSNGFLALIGPKRTNYSKHNAIIKYIRKISKDYA